MTDMTMHDMLWQGVMTDMTLLTVCEPGWGWQSNAVTLAWLVPLCGLGWCSALGNHRVLVTSGDLPPAWDPEHTSPALAIIDQRQLRLWLRVTRHRLLLLVLAEPDRSLCSDLWEADSQHSHPGHRAHPTGTGPLYQWHPVVLKGFSFYVNWC